ncbi:P-loop containing nucleoside triphosphate hydrolase protein [Syncephalis fuscata]|nr:P-loop containing nucleoside triphosphate hydrolase protein [Syncephalis fuscata]
MDDAPLLLNIVDSGGRATNNNKRNKANKQIKSRQQQHSNAALTNKLESNTRPINKPALAVNNNNSSNGSTIAASTTKRDDDEPRHQVHVPDTMPDWLLSAVKKNVASDASASVTADTQITIAADKPTPITNNLSSDNTAMAATARTRDQTSSLFTANPVVPSRVDRWRADKARQAAGTDTAAISNGVLDDRTFSGLGLNADLAHHLSERMNVKQPTGIQRHMLHSLANKDHANRDAILQSETGSGKTLAYLLPIVHQLLEATPDIAYTASSSAAAREAFRSLGTIACVLTPTRELARQVYTVLERLLHNCPTTDTDSNMAVDTTANDNNVRKLHWIVPGLVSGGDKRQSEKARLRKGVTILVCTPGRLLDHLQNTQSFLVGQLRWLVLDEADRLLDLGFEDTLLTILKLIEERRAFVDNSGTGPDQRCKLVTSNDALTKKLQSRLLRRRQIILCSATLQPNIRTKGDADAIESGKFDAAIDNSDNDGMDMAGNEDMVASISGAAPKQLRQSYVVVPAKLRLVTLCTFLKSALGVRGVRCEERKNKIVVFLSCCGSVDFIYKLLVETQTPGRSTTAKTAKPKEDLVKIAESANSTDDSSNEGEEEDEEEEANTKKRVVKAQPIALMGHLLPNIPLFKLHGNMVQADRSRVYSEFCAATQGVLICTDVAARGLHLPDVDQIVQYDAPCDIRDYAHRVGRTARLGRGGDALLFLLPSEMAYIDVLKGQGMQTILIAMEDILGRLTGSNSGGRRGDFELAATNLQLQFERWITNQPEAARLAREAFTAHVRAYATHAASEKHIFHIKFLHLGHLAKSFGLREAPGEVSSTQKKRRIKEVGKLKQSSAEQFAERKRSGPFERPQKPREPGAHEARRVMQAAAKRAHDDEFAIVSDARALLLPAGLKKRRNK